MNIIGYQEQIAVPPRPPTLAQRRQLTNLKTFIGEMAFAGSVAELNPGRIKWLQREINKRVRRGADSQADLVHFFDTLSQLKPEAIDWSSNSDAPRGFLGKLLAQQTEIQNWLQEHYVNDATPPAAATDREQLFARRRAQCQLAARFGYGFQQTAAGANGAKRIHNFEGAVIGYFKPIYPSRNLLQIIVELLKRLFGQARLLPYRPGATQHAEVLARDLEAITGTDVAPMAEMVTLPAAHYHALQIGASGEGALLEPLEGYNELADRIEEMNGLKNLTERELCLVHMAFIYDFLRGNMDAHFWNILIKIEQGHITDIRFIDAGNCFRHTNPYNISHLRGSCGAWRTLAVAQVKFPESVKQRVRAMKFEDLELLAKRAGRLLHEDSGTLLRQRFEVLQNGILRDDALAIRTPAQLGAMMSNTDFRPYLNS